MDTETTEQEQEQERWNPNPTGKGGFGDNPQNRNPGGWNPETSISYNYNKFLRMTMGEFKQWKEDNPEDNRTYAQKMAMAAINKAVDDLKYLSEVTDRVEGKPRQTMDFNADMKLVNLVKDITDEGPKSPETTEGN